MRSFVLRHWCSIQEVAFISYSWTYFFPVRYVAMVAMRISIISFSAKWQTASMFDITDCTAPACSMGGSEAVCTSLWRCRSWSGIFSRWRGKVSSMRGGPAFSRLLVAYRGILFVVCPGLPSDCHGMTPTCKDLRKESVNDSAAHKRGCCQVSLPSASVLRRHLIRPVREMWVVLPDIKDRCSADHSIIAFFKQLCHVGIRSPLAPGPGGSWWPHCSQW